MKEPCRLVLIFLLTPMTLLLAGEYGSIVGVARMIDNDLIQPLTPAQITIVEANITAETNEFGEYFIPNVRAGQYTMRVQWCDVYCLLENVTVYADFTTFLDLNMRYNPVADPDFGGSAKEQFINSSKTYGGVTIAYYDIGQSPATTLDELIRLQPGIVRSDYGLHLRGSTSDDIAYYTDGLIFMWPYVTGWQQLPIPLSVIEEVSLQSSGIEAEYGETRTGIVNAVTRQGGARHATRIYYFTDEILPADRLNFGYNSYDISLSGPLPVNFSYFLSGDLLLQDAFQEAKYKTPSPRNDYHGYGKLTYQLPSGRGQLSLSGFRAREQWVRWNPYIEPSNNLKYFDQRPMTRTKYWYGMAALDCRFSSKNLTSLRIGIDHFDRCYGNRDYIWEEKNGHSWYDDYRFKAEHLIPYLLDEEWQVANLIPPWEILVDSIMTYHTEPTLYGPANLRNSPWGYTGIFIRGGDYRAWSYFQTEDMQIRFDINQYLNAWYGLKTGFHYIKYYIKYFNNPRAWAIDPMWDYVDCDPYRIAAYLQNNLRVFNNILGKIGLRMDYFNPNFNPNISVFLYDTLPLTEEPQKIIRISPRIDIVIPLNNDLKMQLNYGHYLRPFFTYPSADISFYSERTVAYEFITRYNATRSLTLGCNLYHKRHYDWMQILSDQHDYVLHMVEDDREYDDYVGVLGALFEIHVIPWQHLSLNISYNSQIATGSNIYWYYDNYNYQTQTLTTTAPADFDETHQVRMQLSMEFPTRYRHELLRSTESTVSLSYHSGQPYTPTDLRGNPMGDKNSRRMPGYTNVDCKVAKRFRIGRTRFVLSALVLNLFNTTQITDVYTTTGDPDDHGDLLPSIDQFTYMSISSAYYSPQADFDHDGLITPAEARDAYVGAIVDLYLDPTNYANPFRIRLGIGIEF